MSKKKASKKKNLKYYNLPEETGLDRLIKYLIYLVAGFIPLIVLCKLQDFYMPAIEEKLNFSSVTVLDFFTYYKQIFLLVITLMLLLVYLLKLFLREGRIQRFTSLDIPIIIFVISLCITTIAAEYKTLTIWGGYTRNLGVISYLACTLILYIMTNVDINLKWEKTFFIVLYPLVLINTVMMILYYYGINLWENDIFRSIMAGENQQYLSDSARIYGTLNHVNYLSGLGAILFALFAGRAVLSDEIFTKKQIVTLVAAAMSSTIVFASESMSGVVTMIFITVILVGLVMESKREKIFPLIIVITLSVLAWIILSLYDSSFIRELGENVGLLLGTTGVALVVFGGYLLIKYWKLINKKKVVAFGVIAVIVVIIVSTPFIAKTKSAVTTELDRINSDLIEQRLKQDEFDFPEAKFTWGTGRLYIWKETLKLVGEKPLFGHGFGTLPFEFDQTDPAKIAAMERPDVIIDKPHNVYINMLFGAGIVSFMAFMAIILIVIVKAIKAIISRSEKSGVIWPILLGILAYLAQGMFNDPVQGVESLFWVMLGLCYGLSGKVLAQNVVLEKD